MTTVDECLDALREAARQLGASPSKAQYEALGLTPASATIVRVCGGWNDAKEQAGLEAFEQSPGGGQVAPKPDWVDLPEDETWEEFSPHQRWYRKNRERQEGKKRRRRAGLRRWVYELKLDECACARCGEDRPGCLDFHHPDRTAKTDSVSNMVVRAFSKEAIREEIEACEVLCANCHRLEHFSPPSEPDETG
jgi:hypothetical protein